MFATGLDLPSEKPDPAVYYVGWPQAGKGQPVEGPSHNAHTVLGFQILSPWYDEFLNEEDYWFLVFTVGATLGCGGFEREGEVLMFQRLKGNKIRTFSWRQREGDTIPDILENVDLRSWREGSEV